MNRYVRLKSSWSPSSRLRICAWMETSSAETGSSQMISLRAQRERPGDADALALPARELVRVAVVVLRVQADAIHQLLHAATDVLLGASGSTYGAPMICPTVCRGFSDEYGSWKIICISRRSGRIWRLL